MLRYTLKRVFQAGFTLLGITFITFLLMELMPGDPISVIVQNQDVSQEVIANLRAKYGLDRPLHERYLSYLGGLLQGDLGYSFRRQAPVVEVIKPRLAPTLLLVLSSFTFALVTSIPLGVLAGARRNELPDHVSRLVSLVGISTPEFWVAIMAVLLFSVHFNVLPASSLVYPWRSPDFYGYQSQMQLYVETVRHLLLPVLALGTAQMATLMRVERSSMVETLQEEYVQLARVYGIPERRILRKHAFRPAQLPIITLVGLNLSSALAGAVVIEQIFQINGMGTLFLDAVQSLDYQLVMGITVILATIFVLGVIVTDLAYAYVDPRISYGGES